MIAELDAQAPAPCGDRVADLIAVSSTLRWEALDRRDPTIDAESGFPALERYLVERVSGQADLLARRSTVHDVLAVTEQISEALRAEEGSIRDPEAAERIIDELRRAQERADGAAGALFPMATDAQRRHADLYADVDHDLRDRMREIVRDHRGRDRRQRRPDRKSGTACRAAAQQCGGRVRRTTCRRRSGRGRWPGSSRYALRRGARGGAARVAHREAAVGQIRVGGDLVVRDSEKWNLDNKALTALRGGYIGVLMVGMLGTVAA